METSSETSSCSPESIPILPTRHGNKALASAYTLTTPHSDPTYEAWKPPFLAISLKTSGNSDPTYEAWKPSLTDVFICVFIFRSYLRGMETMWSCKSVNNGLQFRSYLRGMETSSLNAESLNFQIIPILPTRHGNNFSWGLFPRFPKIPILPTRHGNPAEYSA